MAAELLLIIGTLNRETPYFQGARGDGLHVFAFDESLLTFAPRAHFPGIDNPTFLSVTPDGRHIYAGSEVAEWREGLVTAFRYDHRDQRLTYLNTQPSLGSITAHSLISRDGRRLYVVNYTVGEGGPGQSLAVFDIREDGSLSPALGAAAHEGQGPDPDRQERAHAHSVAETADGQLIVADLGMDALVNYRIDATGRPERLALTHTRPGSGPRHMALSPCGYFLFVINELDSSITSYRRDDATGALSETDHRHTVPDDALSGNHCSDIRISSDGRFLYGANRGHDSIAEIGVDPATGRFGSRHLISCGGVTPRNIALTPSGQHLLVANQNSDRVSVLTRDGESGKLTDSGKYLEIGTPMCLKFAAPG
ncbi:lactonase family protein [Pseudomonas sp. GX19020]|uniref:lactonase family protein n=1 Tax=Pseudomonas sp. GX19020 TaxID=2942277 RepID=UPI002018897A|nr:lactonase family protein [Pseudomonas sp. GX19020]MCL4069069.1 lactonase family protein [Pseudomonas sp. GX19020]